MSILDERQAECERRKKVMNDAWKAYQESVAAWEKAEEGSLFISFDESLEFTRGSKIQVTANNDLRGKIGVITEISDKDNDFCIVVYIEGEYHVLFNDQFVTIKEE
jgi:hypothetical protein